MRISQGVEWALHCCVTLACTGNSEPISTARFAKRFKLPPAYLNKSLQALVHAGILMSNAGPKGGFRLAKSPASITLWDVVSAIEGSEHSFRCTEIRKNAGAGPQECLKPCGIAQAMYDAEEAWRRSLAHITLEKIMESSPSVVKERAMRWFELTRS